MFISKEVFGLNEKQMNVSNKEVEDMFKKEIEPIEFTIEEKRYNYKLFVTTRQLEENELKVAIQFIQGLKKVNNYFRENNKEKIMDIIDLATSLIDLKNHDNDHDNENENIKKICNLIKNIAMTILEDTTYVQEIVGLYELNLLIETFLNK